MGTQATNRRHLNIYTDGGAYQETCSGAWVFVIPGLKHTLSRRDPKGNPFYTESGVQDDCKSGGAEILAVAHALDFAANNVSIMGSVKTLTIKSDFSVIAEALNGAIDSWAKNEWKTLSRGKKKGDSVARCGRGLSEKDKWVFLYACLLRVRAAGIEVKAETIPAHSGVYWNEYCDSLCGFLLKTVFNRAKSTKDVQAFLRA